MSIALNTEIDQNFEFFRQYVPNIVKDHRGKYALLHAASCTGIYSTLLHAVAAASDLYKDGVYSIQEVTDSPVDLGFFSHADNTGDLL